MNSFISYIRNFFALLLLLLIIRQLIPNGTLQKYIYFFTEVIFAIGVLQPVFSLFGDGEVFLEKVRYETFTESLNEAAMDVDRMEFLQKDYYRKEYEKAAALDVESTADSYLAEYGLTVKQAAVELTEHYEVKKIVLCVEEKKEEEDTWGKLAEQGKVQGSQMLLDALKEKLILYYGVEEEQVQITYGGGV